jgi:hypothetical protein
MGSVWHEALAGMDCLKNSLDYFFVEFLQRVVGYDSSSCNLGNKF